MHRLRYSVWSRQNQVVFIILRPRTMPSILRRVLLIQRGSIPRILFHYLRRQVAIVFDMHLLRLEITGLAHRWIQRVYIRLEYPLLSLFSLKVGKGRYLFFLGAWILHVALWWLRYRSSGVGGILGLGTQWPISSIAVGQFHRLPVFVANWARVLQVLKVSGVLPAGWRR